MYKQKAFTLVELLTTIVIIALLVGLLLPSIAAVRRKSKETAQRAQFASIETSLDAFKQDYGDWPPSSRSDAVGNEYPGAMKLAEALLGWDLHGFHPKVTCNPVTGECWRRDGYSGTVTPIGGNETYDPQRERLTSTNQYATFFERKGPYLDIETTPAFRIGVTPGKNDGLYINNYALNPQNYVICDVFGVRKITIIDPTDPTNTRIIKTVTAGSPVLYYRANTASKTISAPKPANGWDTSRIYNYYDNFDLVFYGKLTASGASSVNHPLIHNSWGVNFPSFYESRFTYNLTDQAPRLQPYGGSGIGYGIRDPKFTTDRWPYRPDSYILISAGMDGLYGTEDDIHNY